MEKSEKINDLKARLFSRQYDQHHTRELTKKGKERKLVYEASYSMGRRF